MYTDAFVLHPLHLCDIMSETHLLHIIRHSSQVLHPVKISLRSYKNNFHISMFLGITSVSVQTLTSKAMPSTGI